jgi:hypothetical protein
MPTAQVLTSRQQNRATLARQMLLAREPTAVLPAIERLAGLQAQLARPPFIGLWSRLEGFRRDELTGLLHRREVVRATMMRTTLHLVSARDYLALRPVIQPVLTRGMTSILKGRGADIDVGKVVSAAREHLAAAGPRTFEEIRAHLVAAGLPGDERAMGYVVRTQLPLVQVPDRSGWAFPPAAGFALADAWLGQPIADAGDGAQRPAAPPAPGPAASPARGLVLRYLAAFGPASPGDAQVWSGMQGLREVFDALRPELVTFRDERGRELFDLPGAPRPAGDVAAPPRFLPDFDNLVLAHDDRSRLIADEHRPLVSKPNLMVLPTFLVDGVVSGTWSIQTARGTATLVMAPFATIPKGARDGLLEEAEQLVRFVEPEAKRHDVQLPAGTAAVDAPAPGPAATAKSKPAAKGKAKAKR